MLRSDNIDAGKTFPYMNKLSRTSICQKKSVGVEKKNYSTGVRVSQGSLETHKDLIFSREDFPGAAVDPHKHRILKTSFC